MGAAPGVNVTPSKLVQSPAFPLVSRLIVQWPVVTRTYVTICTHAPSESAGTAVGVFGPPQPVSAIWSETSPPLDRVHTPSV